MKGHSTFVSLHVRSFLLVPPGLDLANTHFLQRKGASYGSGFFSQLYPGYQLAQKRTPGLDFAVV
jgi:hypothetical protein